MTSAFKVPFFLTLCFILLSLHPDIYGHAHLRWSFWGVGSVLLVWSLWLAYRTAAVGRTVEIQVRIARPHYVQALVQMCIYLYWGWHWRKVYDQAELILAQLLFAYVFDMLLCWSRRRRWILGFGQFPIVLSTNLFLWFRDDWFAWQFLMLAVGFMGKEFFRWQKDGRSTHIFNPSGFALTVFSIALLASGNTGLTWGEEIAQTLFKPEFIYVEIFLLGLVVQYFFSVTLMTLSAVAALYLLNSIYFGFTGVYYFLSSSIPTAVFVGLHLLVTDPATSPRSGWGRVLFGALYGGGVFALYGMLEWLKMPTFYDKLLCVPFLNLSIQVFDRWGRLLAQRLLDFPALSGWRKVLRLNGAHMGIWVVFFIFLYSTNFIGSKHEGQSLAFWRQACEEGAHNGCQYLMTLLAEHCHQGRDEACSELASMVGERTAYWRQACEEGSPEGCQMLTVALAGNCDRGLGEACNELGLILDEGKIVQRSPSVAAGYFLKACEKGLDQGCTSAVIADFFRPESKLSKSETAMAYRKVEELCSGGDGLSCYLMGYLWVNEQGPRQDVARGVEYYQRSCDLGSASGCMELAKIFVAGRHFPVDLARATAAFVKACELGAASSCALAGMIYYRGDGVPVDRAKAVALIQSACDLGLDEACERVSRLRP